MGLSNRQRRTIIPGHLYLNVSWSQARGITRSWTVKLGPWSYNTRQKTSTIKLPGGFKYRHRHAEPARTGVPVYRRNGTTTTSED